MTDFTAITQVKITDSDTEVNKHLAGDWVLLDVCNREEGRYSFLVCPISSTWTHTAQGQFSRRCKR